MHCQVVKSFKNFRLITDINWCPMKQTSYLIHIQLGDPFAIMRICDTSFTNFHCLSKLYSPKFGLDWSV